MKNFQKFYNMGMAVLVCGLLFSQIATFNSKTEVQKFDSGGACRTSSTVDSSFDLERLNTSSVEGFQSALEMESAERKTADSKISLSTGSQVDILKGYIGSSSNSNIADGTLRGAIGNTSIAGIGSENNITSAISSLNSSVTSLDTSVSKINTNLSTQKKVLGNFTITKSGNVVTINSNTTATLYCYKDTWATFSDVIPSGWRPKDRKDAVILIGSYIEYAGVVRINTDGKINVFSHNAVTDKPFYFCISYVI